MYLNNVVIAGRLTRDPDKRVTQNGTPVTTFSLAIGKDKDAVFVNCVAWKSQAENLTKYCKKGDEIAVEGSLKNNNSEKDGVKYYRTEVNARSITFGAKAKKNETPEDSRQLGTTPEDLFGEELMEFTAPTDDELPF